MIAFVLLLFCMVLGLVAAHWGRPPEGLSKSLNWWVLNIATPATVLEIVPHLQFNSSLWFLAVSMWLIFAVTWTCFHVLAKFFQWSRNTLGAMILLAGLGNTSFVGFPLIEALRGKEALAYAAIADQVGAFLAINIGGILVAACYTGVKPNARTIAVKIALFPPFIALVLALVLSMTSGRPVMMDGLLSRLSSTLAPLALFSVGLQLRLQALKHHTTHLILALSWKLGLAPALVLAAGWLFNIQAQTLTVSVLEAAMAPMISAAILAEQHDLNPPLANLLVGVGILLSFVTVPLWNILV